MSRVATGIGGGLGAVAGSVVGFYVNRYAHLTRDVPFAELVGAVAGATIGAALTANSSSAPQPKTGVGFPPPRFP